MPIFGMFRHDFCVIPFFGMASVSCCFIGVTSCHAFWHEFCAMPFYATTQKSCPLNLNGIKYEFRFSMLFCSILLKQSFECNRWVNLRETRILIYPYTSFTKVYWLLVPSCTGGYYWAGGSLIRLQSGRESHAVFCHYQRVMTIFRHDYFGMIF